jgi:hypothetical protein
MSVKKVAGVKHLRLRSSNKIGLLCQELRQGGVCDLPGYAGKPYQSVVVDSATSLQDLVLAELMGLPEVPVQLNWGLVGEDQYRERSERTKELLRLFTNIPAHVVFNAKERDHNANKGDRKSRVIRREEIQSFFAADLGGASAGWLQDACGYVARLYVAEETRETSYEINGETTTAYEPTGKTLRRLRTMYHPNFAAGFRSCTPEAVPEWIDNPTWDKIKKVIDGEKLKDAKYPD